MSTPSNAQKVLSIYWRHTKKYKKDLAIIYPMMVIAQVVEDFIQPIIVSIILSSLASGNLNRLKAGNNLWLILLAIVTTEYIGHLIWNRIVLPRFWRTQDLIMSDLNTTTFDHLQQMSARFFGERFAGSLVNQVNKFVGSFERLTDALTWNVFKLIVAVIATIIILTPKAPYISLAILVISAIYIPVIWSFRKRQLPYNRLWAAAETERTGQLSDTVSNILAVKSFANENFERERMLKKIRNVHKRSIDTMRFTMSQELYTGAIQRSLNIVVIIVSVLLAVNQKANVGVIYLALTFTLGIMRRLWDLNNTFRVFTRVFGDAHDMAEILYLPVEILDKPDAPDLTAHRGNIEFKNVVFSHDGGDEVLFADLSLRIKPSEKIGLVGQSGSGKTTLTKLLLRFMDIQEGQIMIDGQNIAEVTQQSLRKSIAYVPQEPLLFHRSLAENIEYGELGSSQAVIEGAAKLAYAHEFINKLEDGYQTLVGERGVKLSGGQRQRIAIARAMLKNAPILLLDEATSALDSRSEILIQQALWKLMEGRTAIVIAHRLSTIQRMDRIIVMENGNIIEEGTHKELLRKNGKYAELWNHQSGGFLEE